TADDREVRLDLEADDDLGVLRGLPGHDTLDEAARLDGLCFDDEPAVLDAAEHEEVLDEPVKALRFGAYVVEECGPGGGVVLAAGSRQDLRQPQDRRDGRAQFVTDDVDERLAELPCVPLLLRQSFPLLVESTAFRDVRARADHADGPAVAVTEGASRPVRP